MSTELPNTEGLSRRALERIAQLKEYERNWDDAKGLFFEKLTKVSTPKELVKFSNEEQVGIQYQRTTGDPIIRAYSIGASKEEEGVRSTFLDLSELPRIVRARIAIYVGQFERGTAPIVYKDLLEALAPSDSSYEIHPPEWREWSVMFLSKAGIDRDTNFTRDDSGKMSEGENKIKALIASFREAIDQKSI